MSDSHECWRLCAVLCGTVLVVKISLLATSPCSVGYISKGLVFSSLYLNYNHVLS